MKKPSCLLLIIFVKGADNIRQFLPIALINVPFKFTAKAFATRLSPIAHKSVSLSQTAFIKGRFIMDGIVSLHEIIHDLHSSRREDIVLKLDFEKA